MIKTTMWVMAAIVAASFVGHAQSAKPVKAAVEQVVADYNAALNGAQLDRVVKVFEPDGVWMPPNQPAAAGEPQLRAWFQNYFSRTIANLSFKPVEVVTADPWAFVRVAVTGTTTSKSSGQAAQQDNKALFIIHKGSDGGWRIARYSINSNKPAAPAQAASSRGR